MTEEPKNKETKEDELKLPHLFNMGAFTNYYVLTTEKRQIFVLIPNGVSLEELKGAVEELSLSVNKTIEDREKTEKEKAKDEKEKKKD